MAATLHEDGFYYAYFEYLTQEQKEVNAAYITDKFRGYGWSDPAIAAMLGNFESESQMNPALWEGRTDHRANGTQRKGFSLAQWTPWAKYINWCEWKGYPEYHMDSACERIRLEFVDPSAIPYEYSEGGQYYPTDEFPMTRSEFVVSTMDAGELAKIFVRNYERPASVLKSDDETQEEHEAAKAKAYAQRAANGRKWYAFITGGEMPPTPDEPDDPDVPVTPGTRSRVLDFILWRRRSIRVVR